MPQAKRAKLLAADGLNKTEVKVGGGVVEPVSIAALALRQVVHHLAVCFVL